MGILLKTLTVIMLSVTPLAVQADAKHTFTTELQEVRTSSINGQEYLTIHIDSAVGPANCQGNVLRVNTLSLQQQAMESVALEAMLTSEPVVITVPLTWNECVDGMPTLTDINLAARIQ